MALSCLFVCLVGVFGVIFLFFYFGFCFFIYRNMSFMPSFN